MPEVQYTADEELNGPALLSIPPKLTALLTEFNNYKIFVIEGGRGSAKTHSVGRMLTYISEKRKVRIFCGREIQNTIEESVYTLFMDFITKFTLAFHTTKAKLKHLVSKSEILFKGFRERGIINVKGTEGANILWVDEAQSLTKPTLDVLLPTLRTTNCKFIFTLNRLFRDDAVMELVGRDDCLHIHINYFENPFCPATLLDEAERCRINSVRDYNHIWLGQPISAADEYLFDFDKLYAALTNKPYGENLYRQRVLAFDWAAQGNDNIVGTCLDRQSQSHFKVTKRVTWNEPDTTISRGKIIALIADLKPNIIVIDIGGGGYNVYCDLVAAGIKNIHPFDGATTKGIGPRSLNTRADGYWTLREWFEDGFLCLDEDDRPTLKQLEKIKQLFRTDGLRQIEQKVKMKAEIGFSPDEADSLMMAVWGCRFLGKANEASNSEANGVKRISHSKRRR